MFGDEFCVFVSFQPQRDMEDLGHEGARGDDGCVRYLKSFHLHIATPEV